ncbi:MAG: hypothetical protein ACYDEJ_03345 [Desulfitobacteriaceae bacterium]
MKNKQIIIKISLVKYLKAITKDLSSAYVTKTYGGHVWISDKGPGECFRDDLNYIEFNESCMFFRISKEVHQHINLEPGCHKSLALILKEIKQKEA